jgi:hypothetical protein
MHYQSVIILPQTRGVVNMQFCEKAKERQKPK